jgi:mono/diheme cytochrome c family protein
MTREGPGRDEFFPAVRRFSTLAASAVYIVLITGAFSALVELPTLRSLWETPYGLVLVAKLALVTLALGVAYFNNRAVRTAQLTSALPRRITVEAGISALILVAVAFLVQTPAPRSLQVPASAAMPGLPFNAIGFTGDLNIHLQVDPNQAGSNRFWTHLFTSDGSSIGEVQLVRLSFEFLDQPLGKSSVDLAPLGQGTFASEGANMSQAGQWAVEVYVRRRGMDDILARYTLEVLAGQASVTAPSQFGHPVPGMPPLVLVGGLVLFAGFVPFLWQRELKEATGNSYRSWRRLGLVSVLIGVGALVFGLATALAAEIPLRERSNPVPATADSLARGREVYLEACWICHGATGLGDGPLGVTLNPRPSNLQIHTVLGVHTDGQLFEWVANGFPNSPMPEFSETYSEEDRWNVINYIRTFADGAAP